MQDDRSVVDPAVGVTTAFVLPDGTWFLTVSESAAILRVDEATVTRAIREGGFPAVKIRRRYVVPAAAIRRMIEEAVTAGRCIDIAEWTTQWVGENGVPSWAS